MLILIDKPVTKILNKHFIQMALKCYKSYSNIFQHAILFNYLILFSLKLKCLSIWQIKISVCEGLSNYLYELYKIYKYDDFF